MIRTSRVKDNAVPVSHYVAAFLGTAFRCRQRYILTRHNRLRLRVMIPGVMIPALGTVMACAVIGGATLTGFSVDGQAYQMKENMAALQALAPSAGSMAEGALDGAHMGQEGHAGRFEPALYHGQGGAVAKEVAYRAPEPREMTLVVNKGDTLAGVMQRAGIGASESYRIVKAMEDDFDPRRIRPGQELSFRFEPDETLGEAYRFSEMQIALDALRTVSLTRKEDGFTSQILEKKTQTRVSAGHAEIEVSMFGSALKAGIPNGVVAQILHVYSWDMDFQRDIRRGDKVEVLYEELVTEDGAKVKDGNILFAQLTVSGQDIPVYRYTMQNGDVDYFTPNGHSMRKALMKTPIDGARLSSGFGMRHHPILGYNRMHKGVDFAAPTGTPIYAAGDGVLEVAGRNGAYGNYIRIRHNSELKTAYAHMSRLAKGMGVGKRVKQGEVIGYVGTTGRSTGPHLHYEVLIRGAQVNPNSVKLPQGEVLRGAELERFKRHVTDIKGQYASLRKDKKLAMSGQ